MDIGKRVNEIYEWDLSRLIGELKVLSKDERMMLYKVHSQRLFPKSKRIVGIEDLLNDNVKVSREKFKSCFMIVCQDFFSTSHFGEYCKSRFMKKCGLNTQRFPQKVILTLSLMGYIKEDAMKCNYSSGNHGYIYNVDYLKFRRIDMDMWNEPEENLFGEYMYAPKSYEVDADRKYSDVEKEWLVEKQLNTIKAISIDHHIFKSLIKRKDNYLSDADYKTWWNSKELYNINSLERLYHKSKSCFNITIDGEYGRLYSVLTRLKSEWRRDGTLNVNGEGFCEVDLSSLHPTLFGLKILKEYPHVKSLWVEHCLKGDFYEWVIDITGIGKYPAERIVKELNKEIYGCWSKKNEIKSLKKKAEKLVEVVKSVEDVQSHDMRRKLRPVVKLWIMKLLFSHSKLSSTEKLTSESTYKLFCHNLCKYLKEHEPYIYNMLAWYKDKNNLVSKRKYPDKLTSRLPLELQQEEVRFIKQCLKNLDREVEYLYTIHDCVGCLVSEGEKVKQIMEQTAMDMYGVKLHLKIEVGDYYDPLELTRAS